MVTKKQPMSKMPEHAHGCKSVKAVFGLLVLITGLYGIAGDMGLLGAKTPVSPWWILVTLFGLGMLLKASASGKCPGYH